VSSTGTGKRTRIGSGDNRVADSVDAVRQPKAPDEIELCHWSPSRSEVKAYIDSLEREFSREFETKTDRQRSTANPLSTFRCLLLWFVIVAACSAWLFELIDRAFK
jgi:hypothetical protein